MTGRVLAASSIAAHNTPQTPDAVAPRDLDVTVDEGILRVTMPPHSFATVSVALDHA